jgi:hypothetical protein
MDDPLCPSIAQLSSFESDPVTDLVNMSAFCTKVSILGQFNTVSSQFSLKKKYVVPRA